MAPPAKVTRRASNSPMQFTLSKNPFVEDSIKEKVQRWNIVAPNESNNKEDSKALTLSEKSGDERVRSNKSGTDESKKSSKKARSNDKSTDTEREGSSSSDKEKSDNGDTNQQTSKKKRQRSKTTGDARIEWPST